MNDKNHFFWICLTGTVFLAAGVIFLPRYFSRSLDLRTLNHAEISERDGFSFLEPGSGSVQDNVHAFGKLEADGGNLVKISSIENPIQVSRELLNSLYDQALMASEQGVLPELDNIYYDWDYSSYTDTETGTTYQDQSTLPAKAWINYIKSARYYSLTYESDENPNKKELLNFWYLCFSDDDMFDYQFLVDAVSCQIYYAKIYNEHTEGRIAVMTEAWEMEEEAEMYEKTAKGYYNTLPYLRDWFSAGCMAYYGADSCEFIGPETLYEKLGLLILYFDMEPLYMEQLEAESLDTVKYRGLVTGFQEVVNKIDLLNE